MQLHIRCLYRLNRVLSVQNECSHGPMWGLEGAVYAALIVSSLDLREAHLSVPVTGWAEAVHPWSLICVSVQRGEAATSTEQLLLSYLGSSPGS